MVTVEEVFDVLTFDSTPPKDKEPQNAYGGEEGGGAHSKINLGRPT